MRMLPTRFAMILAACLLTAALPAAAAVLVINPTEFKPANTQIKYWQMPTTIAAHADNIGEYMGWLFIDLPVGSVITGGSYFHMSSGQTSRCYLYRLGKNPAVWPRTDQLLGGASGQNSAGAYVTVPLSVMPGSDMTVKRKFRYYVFIGLEKEASAGAVKITYTPPAP